MTRTVCHQDCLEIHAIPVAIENFQDDRGIDVYALSLYADTRDGLRWENITTEDNFSQVYAYLTDVAVDYLANGDVECQRQD
jgi:hypothetical protein